MSESSASRVRVTYGTTDALFASQYVVNSTDDGLIVNFSSGHIAEPANDEALLPIHTRIALTRGGAERLVAVLQQALHAQPEPVVRAPRHRAQATFAPMPGAKVS